MMSTFSSLYSSVTGEAAKPSNPDRPQSSGAVTNTRPAQPAVKPSGNGPMKRKADEPQDQAHAIKKPAVAQQTNGSFKADVPYRRTAEESNQPSTANSKVSQASGLGNARSPTQSSSTNKPSAKTSTNLQPKSSTSAKQAPAAKPAAPKGSYAQMMAKASQAKQLPTDANIKKEKAAAAPKLSLKERQAQMLQEKEKAKSMKKVGGQIGSVKTNGTSQATSTNPVKVQSKSSEALKPKRQPTDLGYKGTMRPLDGPPSTTSSNRTAGKAGTRPPASKTAQTTSQGGRYRYASESEEDYSEDDGSDDMEDNGFGALEDEENFSLRAARKEDAEALREETEHARKKAERRRQLEALKASRKK